MSGSDVPLFLRQSVSLGHGGSLAMLARLGQGSSCLLLSQHQDSKSLCLVFYVEMELYSSCLCGKHPLPAELYPQHLVFWKWCLIICLQIWCICFISTIAAALLEFESHEWFSNLLFLQNLFGDSYQGIAVAWVLMTRGPFFSPGEGCPFRQVPTFWRDVEECWRKTGPP